MPPEFQASAEMSKPEANSSLALKLEVLTPGSPPNALASARELLLEYGRFVAAQPTVASFCYGALEQEAATLPHSYLNQSGGAILAISNDHPVGFVAWRSLPNPALASAWELKRLWIRPEARGSGTGRRLVQVVIDHARAAGKSLLLLDTEPSAMAAAHRLYLHMGFVEREPYNGRSPDGIIYLQKVL
jgi:putative acetyltransferase